MRASILSFVWLASEKLLRIVTGVFVGLWIARYLAPQQYGVYMYALAWVGLFNGIAWFGVGENVIRNLVRSPDSEGELMGAAFAIRLIGSLLAGTLAVGGIMLSGQSDPALLPLVILMSLAIPFAEMPAGIFMYFQSRLQVARPVMLQNCVRIAGAAMRIGLILGGFSLPWFGAAVLAESIGIFLVLFGLYWMGGGSFRSWRFEWRSIGLMLRQGTPIALAAVVASLNARVDQLMLGWLAGFSEVGLYGAALRFSEFWWTFAPVVMNSLSPKYIFNVDDQEKLKKNIARIMAVLGLISFVPVIIIMLSGEYLIPLLLGEQYASALPVLYVHVIISVCVFFDAPLSQYLLANNRQHQMIWKSVFMLVINAMFNFALIRHFGALGAAWATLAAYVVTLAVFYRLVPGYADLAQLQRAAIGFAARVCIGRARLRPSA